MEGDDLLHQFRYLGREAPDQWEYWITLHDNATISLRVDAGAAAARDFRRRCTPRRPNTRYIIVLGALIWMTDIAAG
jgi:hypothetical protein